MDPRPKQEYIFSLIKASLGRLATNVLICMCGSSRYFMRWCPESVTFTAGGGNPNRMEYWQIETPKLQQPTSETSWTTPPRPTLPPLPPLDPVQDALTLTLVAHGTGAVRPAAHVPAPPPPLAASLAASLGVRARTSPLAPPGLPPVVGRRASR